MGFFSGIGKVFKSAAKVVKKVVSAPFEGARDAFRAVESLGQGVGQLAKGDVEGAFKSAVGAVGHAAKGALTVTTAGGVSDNGWVIDTKVKEGGAVSKEVDNEASVSFADAGSPSVVVGADEVEEDVLKRTQAAKQKQAGFLGGVSSSGSSILIG